MAYILKGRLYGSICGDCQEALANIKVRLYRPADPKRVIAAAVASPKETFALLADAQLGARQNSLIAETTTDGDGNYLFRFGEGYDGGPIEFDIYVERVPNQQPSKHTFAPVQAAITTLQLAWRQGDGDNYAVWSNTLSAKQWCAIRARFDAWTICGRVVECDSKAPLAGMTVRAFDADWLGDDWLGSAVTDGAGRFRIDYTGAAFRKFLGPFNVTGSGPDLYFKVFDPSMTLLPPLEGYARAHMPDRDDASHCFCVELCVNFAAPLVTPWFTSVGDFDINTDVNSSSDGKINKAVVGSSGSHGGAGFAFTGDLTLVGQVPAVVSGQPMQYRFMFANPSGSPKSAAVPITGAYLFPVQVEETQPIIGWDFNDGHGPRNSTTGPFPAPRRKVFVAAAVSDVVGLTGNPANTNPMQPIIPPPPGVGPNPLPDLVLIPDVNGWVNVPSVLLAGMLGNKLIGFRSYASGAVPGGGPVPVPAGWGYDVPGGWVPVAGDNAPSLASPTGAGNPPGVLRSGTKIDLYFEAQAVGAAYTQGPLTIYVNNWSSAVLLDIKEFHGGAANDCTPITSSLDIQYTADHELMRAWSVQIVTAATLPPLMPPLPAGSTPRGGNGTLAYNTGGTPAWPNCSYVVYLHTQRSLTNGYVPDDGDSYTWLSFCKE